MHLTDIPKKYSDEMLAVADRLVVVGATTAGSLPVIDGQDRYEWRDISHLEGLSGAEVQQVLIDIDQQVRALLAEWFPDLDLGEPVMQQAPDFV